MIALGKRKKIVVRLRPEDRVIVLEGWEVIEGLQRQHERALAEWRKSCRGWGYQIKRIHGIEYVYRWETDPTRPGGKKWTYVGRADRVKRSKEEELPDPPKDPLEGIEVEPFGFGWDRPHVVLRYRDYLKLAARLRHLPVFPIGAELNGFSWK